MQVLQLPPHMYAKYQATAAHLSDLALLNKLHLDTSTGMYLDWGVHTEDLELRRVNLRYVDVVSRLLGHSPSHTGTQGGLL